MKIEQLLVQHFYNHKQITLQGMGTFTLAPDFVLPENDKEAEIPDNAISFEYDPRAGADDELISYIVQQTRKMRSLAAADLDSYLVLGKQFLNIGKPFRIEGLGMLIKNQQGQLEFTKATAFHAKVETPHAAVTAREKNSGNDISFASEAKKTGDTSKRGLMIAAAVVVLGLIGTTAWYFLNKKNNGTADTAASVAPANTDSTDTARQTTSTPDTAAQKPQAVLSQPPADGYTFKVEFMRTADSSAAAARMNVLTARHHTVIMYKKDSVTYALAEPFKLPLTDTARIRDSLNRFYYLGKASIVQ